MKKNDIRLFILGSGTCIPYERRGSSGYALKLPSSTVLLDCGNGTTWKLSKVGINYLEVDHIFLSHFHPDHTSDLIPFLFATRYSYRERRGKPLFIWGAKGFRSFFSALEKAYNGWIVPDCLNILEIEEGTLKLDDFTITARKTPHIESSLAYRIESEGKSLVYTGDTDFSESLIELAKDADVLIIECSSTDDLKVKGHLTPSEVVKIARESKAKRVVVSHLYPICDERNITEKIKQELDVDVVVAEDLLEIRIPI